MSEDGLQQKAVRGIGWTAAESVLKYGVSFVVGVILARLLSPDEYGLIGILTIFITVFEIIIDGGFINALIRKQNAKEIDYSTVFFTNLVLSIFMAGVLFFSSDLIASFFKRPELIPLMRVMCSIVIINALSLVQKARLTKLLDFKTQTKVSLIAAICSGLIGVWMAYNGFGVWALVAQQLSNAGITTILFWLFIRWFPKFQFSIGSFKEMWGFGWKLMLSGIFNSVSSQLHQVVIGKVFSPATLGQYTRAMQFGNIFSANITTVVQKVTFPVLSEIQDDSTRLKSAYKKVIKLTVFPTFLCMMCLAACSKPLILLLLGEKWMQASYLLQILCFTMMLYPLHALNLNAIQVMGRSDLTLKINIYKNLLIIFPIIIGLIFNIYWMLIADFFRNCICYYLNAYYTKYVIDYPIKEQLYDVFPFLKICAIVAIPTYLLTLLPLNNLVVLLLQALCIFTITIVYCEMKRLDEYFILKQIVFNFIRKNRA